MQKSILSPEDAAWLAETIERNHTRFGGFFMGPEDDADKDDKDDDAGDGDDDEGDGDDDQDDDKADWKAKFEAQQRINRNLERRTRKDAATIKRLSGDTKPADKPKPGDDDKVDAEKIRAEAQAEARQAVLRDRVEDKIEAKAAGAFSDPETAVAVLLRKHDIDDFLDGDKIDVEAITDALKELGEKQPNLLAQGGKKFKGDPDNGPRKEAPSRPKSLGDAIANHYKPRK